MIHFLKSIFSFSGRASRSEFWLFLLMVIIGLLIFGYLGEVLDFRMLSMIFGAVMVIPFFTIGMRRMHDVGKSGFFIFIPVYNFFLALTEGQPETNKYGANPRI